MAVFSDDQYKELFDDVRLKAAEELFRKGSAKKLTRELDSYEAVVRDERNHRVSLRVVEGTPQDFTCDCDEIKTHRPCRHIAAMMLLIDREYGDEEEEFDPYANFRDLDDVLYDDFDDETSVYGSSPADGKEIVKEKDGVQYYDVSIKDAVRAVRRLGEEEKLRINEDIPEEEERYDDDYHYFRYEKFLQGLSYKSDVMKKARRIVDRGSYHHPNISTGFENRLDSEKKIGSADIYFNDTDQAERLYYPAFTRMNFDADGVTEISCYGNRCSHKKTGGRIGHELCEHELAAVLIVQDYLKSNTWIDKTDNQALYFMNAIGAGTSYDRLTSDERPVKLEPCIYRNGRGGLACQFKIGIEKMYKVKDIPDLSDSIRRGEQKRFGKNTDIYLSYEVLTEDSRKWFEFMEGAVREERMQLSFIEGGMGDSRLISDEIPLFGKLLDDFFEIAKDKTIESVYDDYFMGRNREKGSLTCKEGKPEISLSIVPETDDRKVFHGIRIEGSIPSIYRGNDSYYSIQGGVFYHMPASLSPVIHALGYSLTMKNVSMHVGRGHLTDFIRGALPGLRELAELKIDEEDYIMSFVAPEARIVYYFDAQDGFVICEPDAYYGNRAFNLTDLILHQDTGKSVESFRDEVLENAALNILMDYIMGYDKEERVLLEHKDEMELYAFLTEGLSRLEKTGEVQGTERFRRLMKRRKVSFSVGVSVKSDLMELQLAGDGLDETDFTGVLNAYKEKKKYYRIKSGEFVLLEDNETIGRLLDLIDSMHISLKEAIKGKMHLPLYRALYVEKMLMDTEDLRLDRDHYYRNLLKDFKSVEDADFEVPEGLDTVMRNYQTTGYRWLMTLDHFGFGGILADDMGLGKTLQAIAAMKALLKGETGGAALVVCPASLVYNWCEEVSRFAPDLKVSAISGGASERKKQIGSIKGNMVYVTSYDLLKRDIAEYDTREFRLLIIDEAQYIKNPKTAASKSIRLVRAKTRFALTGTPIENRLEELWSIFDCVMPGFLFDYPSFKRDFELPIMRYSDEAASERLKKMVSAFILRRRKAEVLKELPEKLEELRYARMEKDQEKLYNAQVLYTRALLMSKSGDEFNKSKIEILSQLTRIRQICCDPALGHEDYKGSSAKRQMCMELIGSLNDAGHKTLVFSQFTSMLELLEKDLKEAGLGYYKLTGATPKEKRLEMVGRFNSDETPVFLISLKAGGTGLNLTGADAVIHYDPWWNIAAENQASDRAHRIGQKNTVTVYKLIIKDSIEEKIVKLQETKAALAEDILSADGIASAVLDRNELLDILTT